MRFELDLTAATQWATLYACADGEHARPIATLQRRRIYASGPEWRVFDLNGAELMAFARTPLKRVAVARIVSALALRSLGMQSHCEDDGNGLAEDGVCGFCGNAPRSID